MLAEMFSVVVVCFFFFPALFVKFASTGGKQEQEWKKGCKPWYKLQVIYIYIHSYILVVELVYVVEYKVKHSFLSPSGNITWLK